MTADPLTVPCALCGAQPGAACVTVLPAASFHPPRPALGRVTYPHLARRRRAGYLSAFALLNADAV